MEQTSEIDHNEAFAIFLGNYAVYGLCQARNTSQSVALAESLQQEAIHSGPPGGSFYTDFHFE
jgi:hypothetical protein